MRTEKMNYYFPIGLFLAMFLDGGLTQVFAKQMFTNTMAMESRLVLLFIVMAVCYGNVEHLVMWSAIVGLFYDMFVDANIQNRLDGQFDLFEKDDLKSKMEYMFQFFTRSFIVVLLIYLIDITIVTFLFFWANSLVDFTNATITDLIGRTLGPTLIYNLAWFVVLFLPLEHFFETNY